MKTDTIGLSEQVLMYQWNRFQESEPSYFDAVLAFARWVEKNTISEDLIDCGIIARSVLSNAEGFCYSDVGWVELLAVQYTNLQHEIAQIQKDIEQVNAPSDENGVENEN